ncbi:MAG: AMP-binding protein [Myxococcota bacterium]
MDEIIWRPSKKQLEESRIAKFMAKEGISSLDELIKRSVEDIEWFWESALEFIDFRWFKRYEKLLDQSEGFPWAKWFVGGKTNIVLNCIDKQIEAGNGEKTMVIWEGDDGDIRSLTYADMDELVCRLASAMKKRGIGVGDMVGIFMPMVPEIVAAMFACFKIGAVAIPVFSGFGAEALAVRLADAGTKLLFTANFGIRRGKKVPIKAEADKAAEKIPSLKHIVVFRRIQDDCPMTQERDIYFDEFVKEGDAKLKTEVLDAEARSLVIYTSGTTGRPKGTVHTHAGALAQVAKELGFAFDVQPDEIFFWLTDIGWMMGPWEMMGVPYFGGTFLIFEGTPNHPNPDRLWEVAEKHKVAKLGISPTAIRLMKSLGDELVDKRDLSSLKMFGSTGEPWDEETYLWLFNKVGKKRCPIINISGGTEIIGCLLSPLPISPLKPCTLSGPGLAMDIDIFNEEGQPIKTGIGHLVCKKPAPSMTKGFLNDPERYIETYFSRFPNVWFHGDWAERDKDGFWFLRGRSDDTIKLAGKRTGPAEVETVLLSHPAVVEAAAIGVPDELKGEALVCFAVIKSGIEPTNKLRKELSDLLVEKMGKTLKPEKVLFVEALPKTRSAKIVRGAIKRKYLGEPLGDISSVENKDALDAIDRVK